jgi:exodeoxyribonuclease V gamma subunit
MSFHLHTSNRLERLADRLVDLMAAEPAPPFIPEPVVVHHVGLGRWLKLAIASRWGGCVGVSFPLPRVFIGSLIDGLLGLDPFAQEYERNTLQWHLYPLLANLPEAAVWSSPRIYLADDDGSKRAELASQLSNVLDQYLVFRPDWIESWTAGGGDHWQAELWRRVQARIGGAPSSRRRALALKALRDGKSPFPAGQSPRRVVLFGVSSLPPVYMELVSALSAVVDVHAFVLQPCAEWWGDISTPREIRRELRRLRRPLEDSTSVHLEIGHRLLAAWGGQGRDYLRLWQEQTELLEHADFVEPEGESLLSMVQSDLLNLRDPSAEENPALRREWRPDDDSLQIHSCHTPLRELEVLQDRILDWLQRFPELSPRDIVVMAPDLSVYAPLIPAVFETPESPERRLPYSLADRRLGTPRGAVASLRRLLALVGTRMTSEGVLGLLECPPLREQAGIAEADLPRIADWVKKLAIQYGRDAAHLQQLGLALDSARTWDHGLDRLLAGYAIAAQDTSPWMSPEGGGIAPYPGIEGNSAELAGRFVEFVDLVGTTVEAWERNHTPSAWLLSLQNCIERFFAEETSDATELTHLKRSVAVWANQLAAAGSGESIPFNAVLPSLLGEIDAENNGVGYLTGGITFCELKPLRSLPFQAIAILGLNDGAFPRSPVPLSFDLLRNEPRLGDRSGRADDRYLFLETVISARRWLHLSYLGQSDAGASTLPPSPVLRQLTDYLETSYRRVEEGSRTATAEPFTIVHRLHAFSPEYFSPESASGRRSLFSHSSVLAAAADVGQRPRRARTPFVSSKDLRQPETRGPLEVRDLTRFFEHPSRAFLRHQLRVEFHESYGGHRNEAGLAFSRDPNALLVDRLSGLILDGRNPSALVSALAADGTLPPGSMGEWMLAQAMPEAEEYAQTLRPILGNGPSPAPRPFSVESNGRLVQGSLPLTASGACLLRISRKLSAKHFLRFWVPWVAACAAGIGNEMPAVLASPGKVWRWEAPGDASGYLAELLDLFEQGQRVPLRYFPRTSFDWWTVFDGDEQKRPAAGEKAVKTWFGDSFSTANPEADDPAHRALFGHEENPLQAEFERVATRILRPLFATRVPS